MRNLLNFLAGYNNLIVFLILEGIAFSLLVTGNNYHNSRVVKGLRGLTYGIERNANDLHNYLNLREINEVLAKENTALKNRLDRLVVNDETPFITVGDTVYQQQYEYISAEIINHSVNRQKNFFTVNKGSKQGIQTDMGVVTDGGIVGVIVGTSENFSVAMSLLNIDFKISARLKSNGYFGSLSWDGRDYRKVVLNEIPQHVIVNEGDTIETTGFSALFPEGIKIGTVAEAEKTGSDFYQIKVSLLEDFKKIYFVNIVGNLKKIERLELENQFQ